MLRYCLLTHGILTVRRLRENLLVLFDERDRGGKKNKKTVLLEYHEKSACFFTLWSGIQSTLESTTILIILGIGEYSCKPLLYFSALVSHPGDLFPTSPSPGTILNYFDACSNSAPAESLCSCIYQCSTRSWSFSVSTIHFSGSECGTVHTLLSWNILVVYHRVQGVVY